jgi:hypothetical protein
MQRRLLVVFALMLFALGVGCSVVLAGGGNSGNAKLCQKNGWKQLQTATGDRFTSEEACVSYASQGGTLLVAPTVTVVSADCASRLLFSIEEIFFSAAGFTPNSSLTANIVSDSAGATTTVSSPATFDSSGSATGSASAAFVPPQTTFTGSLVITDGSGISVTTPDIASSCVSS